MSRQGGSQPAVTGISQSFFAKIPGELGFTSVRLKPGKPPVGLADRAQYVAGHAYRERPGCFILPDLAISELR